MQESGNQKGALECLDTHSEGGSRALTETGMKHPLGLPGRGEMDEKFLRAQRLENIGMLASGIAHDLNNVLSPIILAAPVLRERASHPDDLRILSILEKNAERGVALVRQILAFAQGAGGGHQLVDVSHLLRESVNVVRETFPKTIRLEDNVPADLVPIMADPTQIHQVILNLCVNARDSMPAGGTLRVRAANCVLDEAEAANIEGASAGSWLMIHIEDTGSGIPAEMLSRIWEPFFTTKASGKGTGLGLSTVRGIVENHKGFISLTTVPNEGTTFRVYLPATAYSPANLGTTPERARPVRGNGELILIVDDEPQIRDVTAAILKRNGYRVLIAADGIEAISLFAPRSSEISVVVTDLRMPNMDGTALTHIVRRLNPLVKTLTMSGLSSGGGDAETKRMAGAFLYKPFKADALLQAVSLLLHPEASEAA